MKRGGRKRRKGEEDRCGVEKSRRDENTRREKSRDSKKCEKALDILPVTIEMEKKRDLYRCPQINSKC